MIVEYELLRGEARISVASDRQKAGPPGIDGGAAGQRADFFLVRQGRRRRLQSKVANVPVTQGDVVIVKTSGGGGCGASEGVRLVAGSKRRR